MLSNEIAAETSIGEVKPKPVFRIGNEEAEAEGSLKKAVINGEGDLIDENQNKIKLREAVRATMSNCEVRTEFALPTEGPPKLSLHNNTTMFVDVIVNNAVSPVNFSVQNYRQSKNLIELERTMTDYYELYTNNEKSRLTFKDLSLHGYYALKYIPDSTKKRKPEWKRCQIMKPFKENMPILTHLIDHGFYHTTEPESIQPLRKIFLEMPIQSFEAKLHFVDSAKFQFTPEDCHRFHKQVEGKKFCGIVVQDELKTKTSVNPSEKKKSQYKISIILIDTSTEKDVYIHQDYVPKKR